MFKQPFPDRKLTENCFEQKSVKKVGMGKDVALLV